MENIEIKAKIYDSEQLRNKILQLEHQYLGVDHQTDTYFKTNKGRIKLRESSLIGPYLIIYLRPDQRGPKSSVYHKLPVEDPTDVKMVLGKMLGTHVTVIKKREIFLYDNVRIHLDEVRDLGTFIEFEAVMDIKHQNRAVETKKVKYLMNILGIDTKDLINVSYENLIEE